MVGVVLVEGCIGVQFIIRLGLNGNLIVRSELTGEDINAREEMYHLLFLLL